MYCSELVWKIYERGAGITLSPLRTISDYDLSHPDVQATVAARWPDGIPAQEPMVSPQDLFDSDLLRTVYDGR
ncbi:MAG: YiiX/YebB-like N1pC/P60 family cysteine hydrolase, partial [Myxococcota bacterium]|jgi:hypothetical protein|nr:YiiX/YebB-like N1pC/P60 family cysteine hydrolase [Myxococcota bacterium]